jgi:hypothetical protein
MTSRPRQRLQRSSSLTVWEIGGGVPFVTFDPSVILTPGSGRLEGRPATLLYHCLMGINVDTMTAAMAAITNWNGKPRHLVLPMRDSLTVVAAAIAKLVPQRYRWPCG